MTLSFCCRFFYQFHILLLRSLCGLLVECSFRTFPLLSWWGDQMHQKLFFSQNHDHHKSSHSMTLRVPIHSSAKALFSKEERWRKQTWMKNKRRKGESETSAGWPPYLHGWLKWLFPPFLSPSSLPSFHPKQYFQLQSAATQLTENFTHSLYSPFPSFPPFKESSPWFLISSLSLSSNSIQFIQTQFS